MDQTVVNPDRQTIQRTLAQKRAEFAYNSVVNAYRDLSVEDSKKYQQLAKSAPADVQTNGLAQTLAFWQAKHEPQHNILLENITHWLREQIGFPSNQDALQWIVRTASSQDYRLAAAETIALLVWIKRFAEAR